MINWEELNHIHVIRKLDEILALWFNTDIFIVDEKGRIRNHDPRSKTNRFRNPLTEAFIKHEKGIGLFLNGISEASLKAAQHAAEHPVQRHLILPGLVGFEKILVGSDSCGS